jgi:DNA-binding HxlR family transcriptional regulator
LNLNRSEAVSAEHCPIRDVLDRLGDRWSLLVLLRLQTEGTLRFTALKALIPDVSQRMLAKTLRHLEEDGLVSRSVHPTRPPRVDYSLTPLGVSFFQPLQGLLKWASENHRHVRAARAAYVAPVMQAAL